MSDSDAFLITALKAAAEAAQRILEVYASGTESWQVESKDDNSPLTRADRSAHDAIVEVLAAGGGNIPVLSEEGADIAPAERAGWERFWLVDPLDGTKEFLKRNGEFTVNVALVEAGRPVLGVVYAPDAGLLYMGEIGTQERAAALRVEISAEHLLELLEREGEPLAALAGVGEALPPAQSERAWRIVASRSHMSAATEEYVNERRGEHPELELMSSGSSLKLCRVAEGSADEYPRFAPTMEWDTAAADAVCRAAECSVVSWPEREPLRYNKEDLQNPWFLVTREPAPGDRPRPRKTST